VSSSLPRASASQPQNSYRGSLSTIKLTPRQTLPSPAQNSTPTWRRTLFSSAPSTLSALATLHLHSAPSAIVRHRHFVIPSTCATHNLRFAHQSILRYPLLTCPHQFYGIRYSSTKTWRPSIPPTTPLLRKTFPSSVPREVPTSTSDSTPSTPNSFSRSAVYEHNRSGPGASPQQHIRRRIRARSALGGEAERHRNTTHWSVR
jgi:hypothetical protein